jgi:probable F420-dependent oxidoreductase
MKFGIQMFTAEGALTPPEFAKAVEAAGFDAVSFPDHTHLPAITSSVYPADPGGRPPRMYGEIFDVFTALAAAAVVTSEVALGSAVCVLPQRDPIITAKQAASVDRLSGGRLRLGVGAGWNAQEMEDHGVPFENRHLAMRERVEAMKAIWRDSPAQYQGQTVKFLPLHCGPRPAQPGGPPIFVAGESRQTIRRVLRYGDGWIFRARDLLPLGLVGRVAEFRQACQASGRAELPVIALDTAHNPIDLDTYVVASVDEVLFVIRPGDAVAVAAELDRIRTMLVTAGLWR